LRPSCGDLPLGDKKWAIPEDYPCDKAVRPGAWPLKQKRAKRKEPGSRSRRALLCVRCGGICWGTIPWCPLGQAAIGLAKAPTVALTRALIGAIASLVTFTDSSCSLVVSATSASKLCLM